MGLGETERALLPIFKFMERTLAWQCDRCRKKFFLNNIQEAEPETVAPHIRKEFLAHSCVAPTGSARPLPQDEYDGRGVLIDRNIPFLDERRQRE